jgi:hypothetical protein
VKLSYHTLALGSFLFALVVAGLSAYPTFAEEAGIDFWNVNSYQQQLRADEKAHLELGRKDQLVIRRLETKLVIAQAVVDGHCTFESAVEQFKELNRMHPPAMTMRSDSQTGVSELDIGFQVAAFIRATGAAGAVELAEEWECTLSSREVH